MFMSYFPNASVSWRASSGARSGGVGGALSLVLNGVYNFTIKRLELGAFLEKSLR